MGMKRTLDVLNGMVADGVIKSYAIGGAVAAYNHVEASVTEDLDILVSFEGAEHRLASGLVTLGPVLTYLFAKGYTEFRKEGLLVEGWPVQFLPVADTLDAEALSEADEIELLINPEEGPVRSRVLRPEHIVATALRTGRIKDRFRIVQFLEEQAVEPDRLCDVLQRHGLAERWETFCQTAGLDNPCVPSSRKP